MAKRFSKEKYLRWAMRHYAPRKDVVANIKQRISDGTHYACKLDGRSVSSILKEGWAVMDEWVIETK